MATIYFSRSEHQTVESALSDGALYTGVNTSIEDDGFYSNLYSIVECVECSNECLVYDGQATIVWIEYDSKYLKASCIVSMMNDSGDHYTMRDVFEMLKEKIETV